jgi:hypothetical protein
MSDEIQARSERSYQDWYELVNKENGERRRTAAEGKGKVFALLAPLGAMRLLVEYDGSGDEGAIEEFVCRGPDDALIDLPALVCEAVEDFVYRSLPCGWEINEGSYGTVEFDIEARKVEYCHGQRVIEICESAWEV